MLTFERATALLFYNPISGTLTWRHSERRSRRHAANQAGWIAPNGYRYICVDGERYLAHRVAWLMYYGRWPCGDIDHANRNRLDNCIINLREADATSSAYNRLSTRKSSGGFKGVRFIRSSGRYRATIQAGKKYHHLGCFSDPHQAAATYAAAAEILHGDFACHDFQDAAAIAAAKPAMKTKLGGCHA